MGNVFAFLAVQPDPKGILTGAPSKVVVFVPRLGFRIVRDGYANLVFVCEYVGFITAIPYGRLGRVCGRGKGEQQASSNQGFHGAPFCFGSDLRTAFRQYNLG